MSRITHLGSKFSGILDCGGIILEISLLNDSHCEFALSTRANISLLAPAASIKLSNSSTVSNPPVEVTIKFDPCVGFGCDIVPVIKPRLPVASTVASRLAIAASSTVLKFPGFGLRYKLIT